MVVLRKGMHANAIDPNVLDILHLHRDGLSHGVVPVTEVAEAGDDVARRSVSVTAQYEARRGTHFFSSSPWSTNAVTTRSLGNLVAKLLIPCGLAIRLRKRIRSSGTPRDLRTSTAIIAEPPNIQESAHPPTMILSGRHTSSKHGVQEKDPSVGNILRELVVEELGLCRLLVPLDQDLADSNGPAALPQTLLHRLASAHNADAADLALEHKSIVGAPNRGRYGVRDGREVVQALLDEQPYDSVRVEDEVAALRIPVTDHAVPSIELAPWIRGCAGLGRHAREQRDELWCLGEDGDIVEFHLCRDGSCWLLAIRLVVRTNALGRSRPGSLRDRGHGGGLCFALKGLEGSIEDTVCYGYGTAGYNMSTVKRSEVAVQRQT